MRFGSLGIELNFRDQNVKDPNLESKIYQIENIDLVLSYAKHHSNFEFLSSLYSTS